MIPYWPLAARIAAESERFGSAMAVSGRDGQMVKLPYEHIGTSTSNSRGNWPHTAREPIIAYALDARRSPAEAAQGTNSGIR